MRLTRKQYMEEKKNCNRIITLKKKKSFRLQADFCQIMGSHPHTWKYKSLSIKNLPVNKEI